MAIEYGCIIRCGALDVYSKRGSQYVQLAPMMPVMFPGNSLEHDSYSSPAGREVIEDHRVQMCEE